MSKEISLPIPLELVVILNPDEIKFKEEFFTENNLHISQNVIGLNLPEDKSGKNNVSRSTTYQNSERLNHLKDINIDSELNPEKKESVINSVSSSKSSISELKKELMSFSDLIKSTPSKLKSSEEVQNP